jgi:hypothetical protein
MKRSIACLLFACLAAATFAQAAKAGSIGVFGSLGGSSSFLGASYQVSDSLDLRAGLAFDYTSLPDLSPKRTILSPFGIMVDGLFQLPLGSGLGLGIGPRLFYNLAQTTVDTTPSKTVTTDGIFGVGAVANIQYLFAKNFGAFLDGSLMLAFENLGTTIGSISTNSASTRFATNTSLGLIFYVK